jgi:hypothetical protein
MNEYVFQDRQPPAFELVPDGDYILEVTGFDKTISNRPDTNGCDVIELKVKVEGRNAAWKEIFTIHEDWSWRMDVFLKAAHAAPKKGEGFRLTEENFIGLRAWATVASREYKSRSGETKKANKVLAWITNKEKLARRAAEPVREARADEEDIPF